MSRDTDTDAGSALRGRLSEDIRYLGTLLGNVIRLQHGEEALHLVDVEGLYGYHVLAAGARQPQAHLFHHLHVLRPLLHERDVVAGLGQHASHDRTDGPRPDDADPRRHVSPCGSR